MSPTDFRQHAKKFRFHLLYVCRHVLYTGEYTMH